MGKTIKEIQQRLDELFLDRWCTKVMRSRIEPMKKMARSLRNHKPLILNWFRDRGQLSTGAVEGLNNKLKVITRRAFGFRTFRARPSSPSTTPSATYPIQPISSPTDFAEETS